MQVPVWFVLGVAALVIAFGSYRIHLARRSSAKGSGTPAQPPRKQGLSILAGGMYRMGPKAHLFIGIVYVLLGTALIATAFGWNPIDHL
jgi:hypothetical protein